MEDTTNAQFPQPQPQQPPRRLTRTREGRMIAGVCSGMARYFGVDPVLVRLGFVVATLLGFAGPIAYVVAWILMPEE